MSRTRAALTLLLSVALFAAGCSSGSGGSAGAGSGSNNNPPPTTPSSAKILRADAGGICETLVSGVAYSVTPPVLSCNNGADPYTAYLDGSKSTSSSNEPLTYAWSFISVPAGSTAQLIGADTAKPTFTPDVPGAYTLQLVVSAGGVASPRAIGLVVALDDATLNPNLAVDPAAVQYNFHGGLSSECVQCHSGNADPTIPGKPSTHIATSNECQSCHTPAGFKVAGFVNHDEVFGTCSSCHDGVTATGKSANHPATTQECSDCHTTKSFVLLNPDGTFDHTGITSGCSNCHNGVVAIGTASDPSPSGHPNTAADCISCHTTATFKTPFPNHADPKVVVPGTCGQAGCHDGASIMSDGTPIVSKSSAPFPHPDTGNITIACDLCHSTTSYNLGGVFDHGVLARHPIACASCHDGNNAVGKIMNHVPTPAGVDCSACHNTSTFVGGFVDHTSPTVTSQACTACHDGTKTWSFIDSTGATITLPIQGTPTMPQVLVDIHANAVTNNQDCGVCHIAGGSFALARVDHTGFGTVGNISLPPQYPTCTLCHDDTVATGKPTGHLQTTQDCGTCHDPQRNDFLGAGYDHSALAIVNNTSTPTCASCHDGTAATGKSVLHVPQPLASQDCLVCHGTGFVSFAVATFDHTAAGATTNCASCHDGKAHDGVVVISKPTGHIPTSFDCSKCHASTSNGPGINGTTSSGFRTATPFVNTVHPAFTTGCRSCHNGSYDNAIFGARGHPSDSVHATVDANGWDCNACHSTTGQFLEANPVNHQDPAVKAQQCIACHDGNTPGALPKNAGHPSTSNACQNCHQAGGSFVAGFDHTTMNSGGVNQNLACTTCHDGVTATGKSANHLPTTRDCRSCHAGYPPTVASFVGGTFDHTGPEMTGKLCAQCHNGTIATGKSTNHVATNSDCGACHSTDTFANATAFNHTGVTSGCQASGCHTSGNPSVTDVTDDPNPKPHIPIAHSGSEVDCYACHKNAGGTFANATMDHTVVTWATCESCHDGNHDGANAAHIVTPKSATHFVTTVASCASCHTSTSVWTTVKYTHVSGGGYPGDHNASRVTKCAQCHNNSPSNANISTFPHATYGSTCAACHASQGTRQHGNPLPSKYYNCGNSGCHRVSSSSF
jgi:hypothetical protein